MNRLFVYRDRDDFNKIVFMCEHETINQADKEFKLADLGDPTNTRYKVAVENNPNTLPTNGNAHVT